MSFRLIFIAISLFLSACSSIPPEQRENTRNNIKSTASINLNNFITNRPQLKDEVDGSLGYFVSTGWTGMAGLLGRTDTIGVLVDKRDNSEVYLDMDAFDFGVGIGSADITIIVFFSTDKALEDFKKGGSFSGANAFSVSGKEPLMHFKEPGMSFYLNSKSGAGMSMSASYSRVSLNEELNDMGTSDINNMPTYSKKIDEGKKKRYWNHTFPLWGQDVIDKGYSLPLPLGIDFLYVDIEQDLNLSDLSVGFNGGDKKYLDFVSFDNSFSDTKTAQVKFDLWLMPFMNLFASIGKVNGDATVDVVLDGNLMLENMGEDCNTIRLSLACNRLKDQTITFGMDSNVDVRSFTLGTVLAGGWGNWFGALPLSWSMIEQKGFIAGGLSFNASPRIGYSFALPNYGRLSLFSGGNYLASNLEVEGAIVIPEAGIDLTYTINQTTKDRWNGIVGFNWDINKKLSWSAEYNGFFGTRESFITGLTVRY